MFVDFNQTFKGKPLSETEVPDLVVNKLSESLPEGVKYVADKDGTVRIVSETGEIRLGGFSVRIPEDFKIVLGQNPTQNDLLQLSYNAQRPIEMELSNPGYIKVNGTEIPFERLHYNIFHKTELIDNKLLAYTATFPKPFEISVSTGNGKYTRKLRMSRKPLLSLNEICFQSEAEQPFQMEFLSSINAKKSGTVSIKMELQFAKSIRDMVEAIFIYNDFVDGKAKMNEHPFEYDTSKVEMKKYDLTSAEFWEKVLQIEECLGRHFSPPDGDTDFGVMCDVEFLYRNLICNTPIKQKHKLTSVTGRYQHFDDELIEKAKAGQFYFQYQAEYAFELFGDKFKLPAVCGLFDTAIKAMERQKDGKLKMELKDVSSDRPSYTSSLCFKDQEKLDKFISEVGDNASAVLENAKLASDYLK